MTQVPSCRSLSRAVLPLRGPSNAFPAAVWGAAVASCVAGAFAVASSEGTSGSAFDEAAGAREFFDKETPPEVSSHLHVAGDVAHKLSTCDAVCRAWHLTALPCSDSLKPMRGVAVEWWL